MKLKTARRWLRQNEWRAAQKKTVGGGTLRIEDRKFWKHAQRCQKVVQEGGKVK